MHIKINNVRGSERSIWFHLNDIKFKIENCNCTRIIWWGRQTKKKYIFSYNTTQCFATAFVIYVLMLLLQNKNDIAFCLFL